MSIRKRKIPQDGLAKFRVNTVLVEEAKAAAALKGVSLSEWMRQALRNYLMDRQA